MSVHYTSTQLASLFLSTSLSDSVFDYHKSLTTPGCPHWTAVILTASNEFQAQGYRLQLEARKSRLCPYTDYLVVPDRDNRRVGSAGSSLSVIRMLKEKYGDLTDKRFLCIHAGGNSSRCPQYSALGKLFAPLPTAIDGAPATLFDMFLVTMASIAGRLKNGMLLLSGDVTLLFNPLMCDFGSSSAAVISFKEKVETGKDHGVYVKSESGNVKKFLHKQPVELLKKEGAVDERGMCSIDTGAIWICPEIEEKLYSLVDTEEKYDRIVNDRVRLSLYSDIAYCLAEDSTLEDFYRETPEGEFCDELTEARTQLWNAVGGYRMKLLNIAPAKFVHFGSIPEILALMSGGVSEYEGIGWKKQVNSSISDPDVSGYNSILSADAEIGKNCYLEVSYVHSDAKIGNNVYLSYVDVHDETVPDDLILHGLKQNNGRFICRVMHIRDNPKKEKLFGKDIEEVLTALGVDPALIWEDGEAHTLWNAKLYPECADIRTAIKEGMKLYRLFADGSGDTGSWLAASRRSLCSGFNDADPQAIIDWSRRMEDLVKMNEVKKTIREGRPVGDAAAALGNKPLTKIQLAWLEKELERLDLTVLSDFSYAIRLYYYLGKILSDERMTERAFALISETVMKSALKNIELHKSARIVSDETVVRLPLRVNWGGGWSDTCPHCLENGGAVLNAAISLNGELPVEVRLVRIPEKKIVFDSRDMDVHGEFTEIGPLQKTGDPYDPFALQKACLLACGIIPGEGGCLDEILTGLGGGFEMHSEVTNVPKGSGLGTSSILSAAAVKAMLTFTGIGFDEEKLYSTVLAMEQIMSTGGGWQDQVGGITPGIKFITAGSGIEQKISVEKVKISEKTKKELDERFCIICSGQRRLARNLLRDVVGRYIGNEPDSLSAHRDIQKTAALMRSALEQGDVDGFAALLDEHWKLSRMIDEGSSNSLIEQIFLSIDDLIDAKMVCGAGGGGFLQVILKKDVSKKDVHERLKEVFQDFAVDVWDSRIIYE